MYFYQFLGAHSLLIGLLPFFLPVYLWTHGLGLAGLSFLIGISGVTFSLCLRLWQRYASRWSLHQLATLTFSLEIALVFVVGIFTTVPGMALFADSGVEPASDGRLIAAAIGIGICNGVYNAFFWTTQRTLFLQQLGRNNAGRQYGNFQIFVTLFLKAGILLGGFLLETGGFIWLLALSAGVSGASALYLASSTRASHSLVEEPLSVNLRNSLSYKDNRGSRLTFAIDGIFLYLESHFWTLSLFLFVDRDFTKLGFVVVLLTVAFAIIFFFIKNTIDRLPVVRLYRAAVVLYALSWLLRFTLNDDSQGAALLTTLVVITFFSTFFRLAFNKRFFDVAQREGAVNYLLLKSYSSQWGLGVIFLLLGMSLFTWPGDTQFVLQASYLCAAVLSLFYFLYEDKIRSAR